MNDPRPVKGSAKVVVVGIMIVIGVFALILFFFSGGDVTGNVTYNGFTFENVYGVWRTEWQRGDQLYQLDFRHHPEQVRHVPVTGSIDGRFQNSTLYLTVDPSYDKTLENSYLALAAVELSSKFTDPLNRYVIGACTENSSLCEGRPIVPCSDSASAVIYLKQADEAGIILDGNCVTVQGSRDEVVMAANKLLFKLLGIMN